MTIKEISDNKKQYLDLLLLAGEQEDMIDCYLDNGRMYILDDNGVKCECVITDEVMVFLKSKILQQYLNFREKDMQKP